MARPPPADTAQTIDAGAFRAARIPIRTLAVAATDNGRWAPGRAAGIARQALRRPGGYRPDAPSSIPCPLFH
jgi:hypothetical protein